MNLQVIDEVAKVVRGLLDGTLGVVETLLEGLVFDLDDGIAFIADVGQRGDELGPIHVAEARDLRGHVLQRGRHHADFRELFGVHLDVLIVDMEDLVLEIVDRLDVVHLLPDEVGRVEVEAEVRAVEDGEDLAPVGGGGHDVLAARPFVVREEHRAVLDGDFHADLLGIADDRGPDFFDQFNVFIHILGRIAADESADHVDAEHLGSVHQLVNMSNGGVGLFLVGIERVRIVSQRGDFHALGLAVSVDLGGLLFGEVGDINVADAGVTAVRAAGRPAGDFKAFQAVLGGEINDFLKSHTVANGGQQT